MERALIIAAHGSSVNPIALQPVSELVERLSKRPTICQRYDVVQLRLLAQKPRIDDVDWQSLDATVVPFFMADGYFVREVLPRRVPGSVRITRPLGAVDLSDVILSSFDLPRPRRLLMVGHGTPRNPTSADTVVTLAERLGSTFERVDVAFVDQAPQLAEVWASLPLEDIAVVPYFAFAGPHVSDDIPAVLGLSSGAAGVHQQEGRTIWYGLPVGAMPGIVDVLEQLALEPDLDASTAVDPGELGR